MLRTTKAISWVILSVFSICVFVPNVWAAADPLPMHKVIGYENGSRDSKAEERVDDSDDESPDNQIARLKALKEVMSILDQSGLTKRRAELRKTAFEHNEYATPVDSPNRSAAGTPEPVAVNDPRASDTKLKNLGSPVIITDSPDIEFDAGKPRKGRAANSAE